MEIIKDLQWHKGITATELLAAYSSTGYQSTLLSKAADTVIKMKKNGAKIYLTFTSNMVTSGLRGFFAQLIKLGIPDILVTTVGAVEEDIMRAFGEKFIVGSFDPDDMELYERGCNRVGNIYITNESYCRFEDFMAPTLQKLYDKQKRWPVSEMLAEIGLELKDENSILFQAAKQKIPLFCPAITDGAFGFHLFMFQQKHPDFIVDVVKDFSNILFVTSQDDKKGIIALGGGVSKHHAIFAGLLNGGMDYAIYMTTSHQSSGSMSGATTKEAKSWGKVKDESDVVTVMGDVTITFPLMMCAVLDRLTEEGLLPDA
ncbi:MAG: deoxyhypusine synthase family protein [Candidatus Woesearchaeota archaeon]